MNDLVEFLLARIAEDERMAEAVFDGIYALDDEYPPSEQDVARQERMQRESEAKGRIVELHTGPEYGWKNGHLCKDSMTPDSRCDTLRALALPYADHPDYRAEEWKP